MDASPVFRLFASCIPVKGARRSVVCDLQRGTYQLIPNGLYEILTEHRDQPVVAIKAAYDHEFDEEIDEYFQFLLDQEFGFWCDEPELFPDLDLTWDAPGRITNALIDVDAGSRHDFPALLAQLDALGCAALEVRFFRPCTLADLRQVLEASRHGRLRSVQLLFPHGDGLADEALDQLCRDYPRLSGLVVHSAPEDRRRKAPGTPVPLHYRKAVIDSADHCGQVHPGYFVTNIGHFTEAQQHNTCLNRKLSIDARGEIRNCPSLPKSFGNAAEAPLADALAQPGFRELWTVHKDEIEVCRDCEFRYVCTDCRAYLTDPGNLYAKPRKCGYDPYTAQWSTGSTR
ncbi:MAG TPA: grasp-with-spasm system SPASM domain peptide maturase [Thermoanaerobaculia bacterium]|nr:grasp-with-spasm system SPASM domain peptide maturase [Thermoanaerobaculia bacterium]